VKVSKQLAKYAPEFKRYYEPFLGAGSLFLELKPKRAYLSDLNPDLICAYKQIYLNVKQICILVDTLYREFDKDRDVFNVIKSWKPSKEEFIAARFLFLVNYSYNGLYRVNSKGEFNVPPGDKKTFIDLSRIASMHTALHKCSVKISCKSYEKVKPKPGSFVYLDPPFYDSFNQYTKEGFDVHDHIELKRYCDRLHEDNILFMQTNTCCKDIKKLYMRYNQKVLTYGQSVSCKNRKKKKMLVITNY
jgi:DNA adenine methylase